MRRRAPRPIRGVETGAGCDERGDPPGISGVRRRMQAGLASDVIGRRSDLRAGDAGQREQRKCD
jgi:hypothetical protein